MANNLQHVYYNTRGLEHSCHVSIFQVLAKEYYRLDERFEKPASLLNMSKRKQRQQNDNVKK